MKTLLTNNNIEQIITDLKDSAESYWGKKAWKIGSSISKLETTLQKYVGQIYFDSEKFEIIIENLGETEVTEKQRLYLDRTEKWILREEVETTKETAQIVLDLTFLLQNLDENHVSVPQVKVVVENTDTEVETTETDEPTVSQLVEELTTKLFNPQTNHDELFQHYVFTRKSKDQIYNNFPFLQRARAKYKNADAALERILSH